MRPAAERDDDAEVSAWLVDVIERIDERNREPQEHQWAEPIVETVALHEAADTVMVLDTVAPPSTAAARLRALAADYEPRLEALRARCRAASTTARRRVIATQLQRVRSEYQAAKRAVRTE